MIGHYLGIHGNHPILMEASMSKSDALAFRELFIKEQNASHLVTEWMIDTFAVAGEPDECRKKLGSLLDGGIDYPVAFEILESQ